MAAFRFGPFILNETERLLLRDGERIPLSGKTVDVLLLLAEAGGRLVDRATFQERLWPNTVVEERNLTVHISTLRKALNNGDGVDYIETVPKVGYRLAAPVERLDAHPAEPGQRHTPQRPARTWFRQPAAVLAAVILIAVGLGGTGLWISHRATPEATDAQPAITLAVLPFTTPGLEEEDQYLGLGIADAVIAQLGGLPQLNVRPTSSVRADTGGDPVASGRRLQVDSVLEGMVQRDGERLRISVQLIDTESGVVNWGERFERPLSQAFDLQDAIAHRVASTLLPRIAAANQMALQGHRPTSSEAYLLQLQARVNLTRFERGPALKAVELFRQAIALDPGYAHAYAGLATAYAQLTATEVTRVLSADEGVALARHAAETALSLSPALAEAHAVLASLKFLYAWDWEGADADYRRALAANPNAAEIIEAYGWFLVSRGRFEDALPLLERASSLNPLRRATLEHVGFAQWMAGDAEKGLEMLRRATEIDPLARRPYIRRMFILDSLGRHDEAMTERVRWLELFDSKSLADKLVELSRTDGYPAALAEWIAFLDKFDQPMEIALQWMAIGEKERALDALERCVRDRCTPAAFLAVFPPFQPLHNDTRFRALLTELRLSPPA